MRLGKHLLLFLSQDLEWKPSPSKCHGCEIKTKGAYYIESYWESDNEIRRSTIL